MICKNCGTENLNNAKFCAVCGAKMSENSENKRQSEMVIVVAIMVLLAVLAGGVGMIIYNNSKSSGFGPGGGGGGRSMQQIISEPDEPKKTIKPTERPVPVFDATSSSSVRGTDTEGGQYSTYAILSMNKETKWAPSKGNDGGIDEWIEISSDELQYVRGVEILNGYHKNYNIWKNNNRVKMCTIGFGDGETRQFVLDDTMDLIRLDFGEVVETDYINLTIDSLYYGDKWNDTAITYFGAY